MLMARSAEPAEEDGVEEQRQQRRRQQRRAAVREPGGQRVAKGDQQQPEVGRRQAQRQGMVAQQRYIGRLQVVKAGLMAVGLVK